MNTRYHSWFPRIVLALVLLAISVAFFACKVSEMTDQQFANLEASLSADAQDAAYIAVKKNPKLKDELLVFAAAIVRVDPSQNADYAKALEEISVEDAALRIVLRHATDQLVAVGSERSQELAKAIANGVVAGVSLAAQPSSAEAPGSSR